MRLSRFAACASSLLLAVSCAVTGAATGQASPREAAATGYVALGDSYSSGVGAGSYIGSSVDCLRSNRAYPVLWAAAHSPSSFSFTACNGASTRDVLARQLGPLSARTGLVSITVGGSDAGFADVMTTCVLQDTRACLSDIAQAHAYMERKLPDALDRVYTAIRRKAPAAHVVVLGYPRLYQLDGTCTGGLSETERSALNDAVDHLNGVTAKRAADHGFTFGDVRTTFSGHGICSRRPWLRSINWLALTESYHPTATGQARGYLPVFTDAT
ncbi:SGNH/GDSL hydrolase family protein [Streptomyces jeddahensis]|uniref:triacylglycerol lipase n=1 Tax=Streptomyces jeddahensis TaxID=1716141 RepID=A0A177HPT5_9ACTN|nr:SGNH/GDSL hydrolase family protein [Streptomyces jeddahensis]OAH12746.1 lipase 1 precursor [Streptomyces jeddahensis]